MASLASQGSVAGPVTLVLLPQVAMDIPKSLSLPQATCGTAQPEHTQMRT